MKRRLLPDDVPMRILVTGGAGFIGSHVVDAWIAAGAEVRVLDNLRNGSTTNLASHLGSPARLTWMEGDVRDPALLSSACAGVDVVCHLAGLGAVRGGPPEDLRSVNVEGTRVVLEASRAAGVSRLIFASSAGVYGDQRAPHHEGLPVQPENAYAASKVEAEGLLRAAAGLPGIVVLRLFNVYGPRQRAGGAASAVVPTLVAAARGGAPLPVHGGGAQVRDFVEVHDVARAFIEAANAPIPFLCVNIGTGQGTSICALLAAISRLSGRELSVEWSPSTSAGAGASVAVIEAAAAQLGWRPTLALDAGLRRLIVAPVTPPAAARSGP